MSTLLEQWRDTAYSKEMDKASLQKFWGTYFQTEKEIYEKLLENPDEEVKGTVKELAEKYGINVFTMTGFLDGINDSLVPYSYSEKAIEEAYTGEGSVLIPIYGKKSTHGFEMNFEEGRDYAETVGLEFLDVHLKEEE